MKWGGILEELNGKDWIFNGKEIKSLNDIPKDKKYIGFIYIICQISTGKKYIGKKLLDRSVSKTIKGKKKKTRTESDWKTYWSSSPILKEHIEIHGTDDFTREILQFVSSKGSLAAAEEMALYSVGALESDEWINNNIRSKIYRSWIKTDEMEGLRLALKQKQLYK